MLKILWKRGKIAPEEQFLLLSTIIYYLMLDFYVKIGIRISLRDKRSFEITEVEITRVDCMHKGGETVAFCHEIKKKQALGRNFCCLFSKIFVAYFNTGLIAQV